MRLELKPDLKNLEAVIRNNPKLISQTLNRLAKTERTKLSRGVTDRYTIKKSDVDKKIRIGPPAHAGRLYTSITAFSKEAIPWVKFRNRALGGGRGVAIEILKGNKVNVRGQFYATVGSHKGIFQRANQDKINPGETRKEVRDGTPYFHYTELPIKERVGPSVSFMAGNLQNVKAVEKDFYERFEKEILRRLQAGV